MGRGVRKEEMGVVGGVQLGKGKQGVVGEVELGRRPRVLLAGYS